MTDSVMPAVTVADAAWALLSFGPLATAFDDLAGFDEPRTYLAVIGNQAEMRPSGGAPLYAAVVTADAGLIRIADKGTTSSHFFPPMNRPVTWTGPEDNPYFAANPRTMPFVSAGANPDFSVSAQEMAAAFEAGGHPAVDGVIYVDMTLLQQVLGLTGPVEVAAQALSTRPRSCRRCWTTRMTMLTPRRTTSAGRRPTTPCSMRCSRAFPAECPRARPCR